MSEFPRTQLALRVKAFGAVHGILAAVIIASLVGCSEPVIEQADDSTAGSATRADTTRRPDQLQATQRLDFPVSHPEVRGVEVASHVEDVVVERRGPASGVDRSVMRAEIPRAAAARRRGTGPALSERIAVERDPAAGPTAERRGRRTRSAANLPRPPVGEQTTTAGNLTVTDDPSARNGLPFLVEQFDAVDFDQNANLTGFFSIPPDPHIAAGPNHVMIVVNTTVQAFNKTGGVVFQDSLRNFFAPLGPLTGTFDPKVLFDTQAGRWVVVTLEQTDRALDDPADTSRIFVAASDDADPAGVWSMTAIDARTMIGGSDHWADYPGFGVDEEAIYIATNMFQFFSGPGNFGGVRLWIVPKGALYNGNAVNVRRVNPYAGDGFALTTQPAQFYGNSSGVGGMLLGYSGLTDGTDAFVQLMRVNNPLGAISIVGPEFVNLGPIDDVNGALPDATQNGNANLIVTNDRRMLNATWVDGMLYGAFTVRANGEATAHWAEMNVGVSGTPTVARQASIPGEQLGGGTHTYYPAVAANARGDVVVGYSASNPATFAGSYYSVYPAGEDVSTAGEPQLLHAGEGGYFRQFGGSNRWGDYSGAVVDPVDGCFWVFNQHAGTPGTPVGQGDGRWETSGGKICLALGFAQSPDVEEAAQTEVALPESRAVRGRPSRID